MDYFMHGNICVLSISQSDMEYHSHPFLELVYITSGSGIHYLDGNATAVSEGDYFIIDYKSRHKYSTENGKNFELINCLFLPSFIDPALAGCESFEEILSTYLIKLGGISFRCTPTACVFKDTDQAVRNIFARMLDEYKQTRCGAFEIMRCHLIEILIITMRKISDEEKHSTDPSVVFVADYINKNYMKQIQLSSVAQRLCVSPQYLSVKFKKQMGMTFIEYLQRVRIGQSCRYLVSSDKKIPEIAELSGYNDIKFFNHIFKKYMNTTPSALRRSMQNQS